VKIRLVVLGLLCVGSLCAQRKFSFQDACFKNPSLPYCPNADFWSKRPTSKSKDAAGGTSGTATGYSPAPPESVTPSLIVVGGVDWRFADPSADALVGFRSAGLSASPLGRGLVTALASSQGLGDADVKRVFEVFSGAEQVVLSIHDERVLFFVSGRAADSALPTLDQGWKAAPLVGNAMLIGPADAVDQALQRISTEGAPGELTRMAAEWQSRGDVWGVGAVKLAGADAVAAGVKRFSMTASLGDRLSVETSFEFDGAPDARTFGPWLKTLGESNIDGNAVHVKTSLSADDAAQWCSQVATTPLGQRFGVLVKSARFLPVRSVAPRTKPMIYGLDDGPQEVKQSFPAAPPARPQSLSDLSGEWLFTHQQGRFQGTVIMSQTGSVITGTWHTGAGKSEADTRIAGRLDGNVLTFTRFVGSNQTFVMTISADGKRLDGFGDGFFLNHTNLNMQRGAGNYSSANTGK